jgi:Ohr subfamily peroxiredoxin
MSTSTCQPRWGARAVPGPTRSSWFAAGYAACFQSALLRFATVRKLDLSGSHVTARIGIGPVKGGGFGLAAALDLDAPGLAFEQAAELMTRAHETRPYSRATRGNIDVELTVGGRAITQRAA